MKPFSVCKKFLCLSLVLAIAACDPVAVPTLPIATPSPTPTAEVGPRPRLPKSVTGFLPKSSSAHALTVPCSSSNGPAMVTDKPDYAPGEIATLAGCGFWADEPIDISVSIDDPITGAHIGDYDWNVEFTDANGAFSTQYLIPQEAAWMILTATAMGYESGLIATVTFTDHPGSNFSLAGPPAPSMTKTDGTGIVSISVNVAQTGGAAIALNGVKARGTTADGVDEGTPFDGVLSKAGGGYGTWTGSFTGIAGRTYRLSDVELTLGDGHLPTPGISPNILLDIPACNTATVATCPVDVDEGDTTVSVSASLTRTATFAYTTPAGAVNDGAVTFTVTRDSDAMVMGTLSGVAVSSGTTGAQLVTVAALTSGAYTLSAVYTGNTTASPGGIRHANSSNSCGFNVASSCTAPTGVTITAPADGAEIEATNHPDCDEADVTVTAEAIGGTAPVTLTYKLDAGAFQASSTFLAVGLGAHTITVKATNACGSAESSINFTIVPEEEPITFVDITSPADGAEFVSCDPVDIAVSADHDGTDVTLTWYVDNVEVVPVAGQISVAPANPPTGARTLKVVASNNCTPVSPQDEITIYVRGIPVSDVTISDPTADQVFTAANCTDAEVIVSASVNADACEPVTFTYSLDGGTAQASNTFTAALGSHSVIATASNEWNTTPVDSDAVSFSVKAETEVTIDPLPADYGAGSCERTVTGTLKDSCGTALVGETVTLLASINGGSFDSVGSDTTDGSGAWSVTWGGSENLMPGSTVQYRATYAGNDSYFPDDSPDSDLVLVHYVWGGVGPPLSETTVRKVKRGSTVPVKFRIYDCDGAEICTNIGLANGGKHTVALYYNANAVPYGDDTWEDAGSSSPSGTDFRYSGTCGDGQWIFNLNTGTALLNCTYKIVINLDDGSSHNVFISIVR
ncbi:MAG TPA: PxKF domain-containing protein [Phycisphaerae bacterium]|nr:PxKF domain-containing protein [Phycisphaerae bacterium]